MSGWGLIARSVADRALNGVQPVISPEDGTEEDAREWADEEAAKIGRIWAARWPSGKDWAVPK